MAGLIDTHAHLDAEQFSQDLTDVLARAQAAGIEYLIAVATTAASSVRCLELTRRYQNLSPTVGVHPNEITEAAPGDWDRIVQLAGESGVVGIGETGLDRYWDRTPFALQEEWFVRHLELGRKRDLTVVIHCRDAEADTVRVLKDQFDRHGPIRGVMHSFVGTKETAEACLAMGLMLSFAGMLTYKNADAVRQVAAIVPHDRVMVETDCPYLSPVPYRGKRNEPAYVLHTANCLAGILGMTPQALAEVTTQNARGLFGLV